MQWVYLPFGKVSSMHYKYIKMIEYRINNRKKFNAKK